MITDVDRARRWIAAAAVTAGLGALAGIGAWSTYGARTSGDEPFYLLTADSVATDGDLDIANQLQDRAFRPYHRVDLVPQTIPLAGSDRQLSPHDPLLPVLLAPAFVLPGSAGWLVAKLILVLVSAATAAVTSWVAIRRLGVRPAVAGVVIGGLAASLPWAGYGTQVYPEVPAALAVVTAVAAASAPAVRRAHLVVVALAAVVLPWLAVKYVPVAIAVVVVAGLRGWRSGLRREVTGGLVALAGAGLGYLAVHQAVYGGWTVYAAGDHFAQTGEFSVVGTSPDYLGRSRRLVGLLVDRRFGLGAWTPVWLAAPVGGVLVWRRGGPARAIILAPVVAAWLTASFVALTMHGWWVPGRQVVVVLPLLALGITVIADRCPLWLRRVGGLTLVAGVVNWLWLAAEATTGGPVLIVDFSDSMAPSRRVIAPLLPDGVVGGIANDLGLAVWAALLATTVALAVVRGSAFRSPVARRFVPGADAVPHQALPCGDSHDSTADDRHVEVVG